jgi:hypothetical protein
VPRSPVTPNGLRDALHAVVRWTVPALGLVLLALVVAGSRGALPAWAQGLDLLLGIVFGIVVLAANVVLAVRLLPPWRLLRITRVVLGIVIVPVALLSLTVPVLAMRWQFLGVALFFPGAALLADAAMAARARSLPRAGAAALALVGAGLLAAATGAAELVPAVVAAGAGLVAGGAALGRRVWTGLRAAEGRAGLAARAAEARSAIPPEA